MGIDDDLTQEERRWKLREIAWEEKAGRRIWSKIDKINIGGEQWWQNKKQRLLRDRYGNGRGVKKQSGKEEKEEEKKKLEKRGGAIEQEREREGKTKEKGGKKKRQKKERKK